MPAFNLTGFVLLWKNHCIFRIQIVNRLFQVLSPYYGKLILGMKKRPKTILERQP